MENNRTKIISAFPGTGKSYYHNKYPDITLDSDSSNFSWVKDENGNNTKKRNPNFPQNYIEHIKENIGKYKYIFVSSHKEVRDALLDNCIFFYIVYPDDRRKEEFIQRYRDRGNHENFITLVDENWDDWLSEIRWIENGCEKVCMVLDNLEDEIRHMEAVDYGEVLDEDE
jgi:hypothetical protein